MRDQRRHTHSGSAQAQPSSLGTIRFGGIVGFLEMVCKEIENEFGLEASFLILHKDMSKDMGKKQKTNGRGIRVCLNKSKALQGVWDKSDNFILVEVVLGKESAKDIECIHSDGAAPICENVTGLGRGERLLIKEKKSHNRSNGFKRGAGVLLWMRIHVELGKVVIPDSADNLRCQVRVSSVSTWPRGCVIDEGCACMLAPPCVVGSALGTTGERESVDSKLDALLSASSVNVDNGFLNNLDGCLLFINYKWSDI
jgi:hypothetical protein